MVTTTNYANLHEWSHLSYINFVYSRNGTIRSNKVTFYFSILVFTGQISLEEEQLGWAKMIFCWWTLKKVAGRVTSGISSARLFRINADCDGEAQRRNNLHKIRKCWLKITPKLRECWWTQEVTSLSITSHCRSRPSPFQNYTSDPSWSLHLPIQVEVSLYHQLNWVIEPQ